MKKNLIILFISMVSLVTKAQGLLYDNAFFNLSANNPAFAGARKDFTLNALDGVKFIAGNVFTPQQLSQIISMDGQVGQNSNGLGFQAFNSTLGNFNTQGIILDYAYRTPVGEEGSLSIGLRGGFTYLPSIYGATNNGAAQFYPYLGTGALLNSDNFFLGLSAPVLFTKNTDFVGGLVNQKPVFASVGYALEASENLLVTPMLQYEYNSQYGSAISVNAKLWISQKFALGVNFKNKSASADKSIGAYSKLIETIEFQTSKSIRLGISYDANPYDGFVTGSALGYGAGSLVQLYFRYQSVPDRERSTNLKYF